MLGRMNPFLKQTNLMDFCRLPFLQPQLLRCCTDLLFLLPLPHLARNTQLCSPQGRTPGANSSYFTRRTYPWGQQLSILIQVYIFKREYDQFVFSTPLIPDSHSHVSFTLLSLCASKPWVIKSHSQFILLPKATRKVSALPKRVYNVLWNHHSHVKTVSLTVGKCMVFVFADFWRDSKEGHSEKYTTKVKAVYSNNHMRNCTAMGNTG